MYEVIRDGLSFTVDNEEKAKHFAEEGCEVYRVDRLRVNNAGEFEIDMPQTDVTGTGRSEELSSPEIHTIMS